MTNLLFLVPIKGFCKHSIKYPADHPYFEADHKKMVLDLILCLIFFGFGTINIHFMYEVCGKDKIMCYTYMSEQFFDMFTILIMLVTLFHLKYFIIFLNNWAALMHSAQNYSVPVMISSENCSKILKRSFMVYFIYMILLIASCVSIFTLSFNKDFMLFLSKLVLINNTYQQLLFMTESIRA